MLAGGVVWKCEKRTTAREGIGREKIKLTTERDENRFLKGELE
jgi:hypothetical protein